MESLYCTKRQKERKLGMPLALNSILMHMQFFEAALLSMLEEDVFSAPTLRFSIDFISTVTVSYKWLIYWSMFFLSSLPLPKFDHWSGVEWSGVEMNFFCVCLFEYLLVISETLCLCLWPSPPLFR